MIKCIECGREFDEGVKICPNCGYPVSDPYADEKSDNKSMEISTFNGKLTFRNANINITAVISLILGIVILIMGFAVSNKKVDIDEYKASRYSVDSAKFGADFYTEIYGAVDTAVDGISGVNDGIASLSASIADFVDVVTYAAGMIIIAVGMSVIAVSILHIKKEE